MITLDQIGLKHKTDKASSHHNYLNIYDRYFEPYRDKDFVFLEIGYGGYSYPDRGGAGVRTWLEYFTKALVISVDLHWKDNIPKERFVYCQFSQDNEQGFKQVLGATGAPEIVIDDASHVCDLTLKTFEILFPMLKPGGWYVIEDIETSFWDGWSKGTLNPTDYNYPTPVNLGRWLVNDLNAKYIPNFEATYQIEEIHFHQNIIFIKKK